MSEKPRFEGLRRRELLQAIGTGALGAACVSASTGTVSAVRQGDFYENPLFGPDFADPTIHRADDGTWWVYASNMSYNEESKEMLVPMLSSPDLVDWTYEGEAFDSRPGWKYGSIWAPDIDYYDGRWVLFYALNPRAEDDDETGIGVATSDTPDGPFTDHGEILSDSDHPADGTIDPYFVEHEGTPYLFFGNFRGVYVVELTPDLQDWRSETFQQVIGNAYEGSNVFHRDSYWYYFGATGDCCAKFDSTYEVEVGRSETLLGPYYDRDGTPMLERDEWNAGPTHLGDNERFVGPGHGDVTVDEAGAYWFVYHAYDTQGPENADDYGWPPARQFFLDRIYWTDDGWPVIGGDETPSASAPVPNLGQRSAPVADGTYRVVNEASGHYLGVDGTGAGASAIVTTADASSLVEWNVTRLSGGEYVLENPASGLVLEVADADTSDGADIQQWDRNGHPTQRWYLVEAGDGTYLLHGACGNAVGGRTVAEVANASDTTGANVQEWTDNGGDHQRWRFVAVGGNRTPTPTATEPECTPWDYPGAPAWSDGTQPRDVDGDGVMEDFNGNCRTDNDDVVTFFENMDSAAVADNPSYYDFNANGRIDFDDIVTLFEGL